MHVNAYLTSMYGNVYLTSERLTKSFLDSHLIKIIVVTLNVKITC